MGYTKISACLSVFKKIINNFWMEERNWTKISGVTRLLLRREWGEEWEAEDRCLWGKRWRKGVFCLVCIFHNKKMHVYLISFLWKEYLVLVAWKAFQCWNISHASFVQMEPYSSSTHMHTIPTATNEHLLWLTGEGSIIVYSWSIVWRLWIGLLLYLGRGTLNSIICLLVCLNLFQSNRRPAVLWSFPLEVSVPRQMHPNLKLQ